MPRYTDASRERVRDAVDFAELVGARTELKPSGPRRLTGLCPFHDERTPSFGIDPVEKLYHCFGCGVGGDLFGFVMATEGVDFGEALELLADRSGVELERTSEDPGEAARRGRRERLLALLERTAAWYVRMLWESEEAAPARAYLAERGLQEESLRTFGVGYAPSAWDKVLVGSRRAGYSEDELLAAGLCLRGRSGGAYDRFRRRITFPLADERGRVVGFGARALGADQEPKYLNSAEGEIFHKRQQLYGLHLARTSAARAGRVVLCEGYTDVIALHQAGIENAIGVMGTAITEEHARTLSRRVAPTLLFCMDADAAGQAAIAKAAVALQRDRQGELLVVVMPAGADPADVVVKEGPDAIRRLLGAAVPYASFEVTRALQGADLGSLSGRERALEQASRVIGGLPEGVLREDLIRLVSDRIAVSPQLVASAAAGASGQTNGAGDARGRGRTTGSSSGALSSGGARTVLDRREQAERAFLALCVALPEEGERQLAKADADTLFSAPRTRKAAGYLRGRLRSPAGELPRDDEELARLVAELVVRAAEMQASAQDIETEALQLELAHLERDIAAGRAAGDGGRVRELAGERQRVLDALRHRLH
ncbi:MAG: DNA primase [Actinomycetota bacterium]|nr:DNA primase [Actinomycetota bacterium]